ncbi:ABC transporter ATP-binding protein [Caldovatus aquaticus]|uniref:ATP-binding cassette domain-containing protein n=1 Tax=Caldovatus aquaticus TaxID=2865671 RepID=A0ABS7F791_9PROT|nr:ATP-binding cassette domain-containing protein [Caldovatus aquaticus]MBW8270670.1 ATP-binding cassette domain-containing protein [Caldovatus aquaticus]
MDCGRSPPSPGLSLRIPGFAFAGVPVLGAFALELRGGETTALLGPSGSGKSTLLRMVAGLLPAPAGARIAAADGGPVAGRLAWMAQQDLLLPWLDLLGNVMLGARLRGEAPDRARALRLIEAVGLAGRERARPAELSGGMRQRAALARTLMEDRPFVLMDEPFSAVDAPTRHRLQGLAARLLAGRTVLLVTHDPLEAMRLAHRVLVLRGSPAVPVEVPVPAAAPPREAHDVAVLTAQGALLESLAEATAEAA